MTESLSVVHVVWGGGFGGIETFVSDLARVQAAMGIGVGILVCGKDAGAVELDRYRAQGVTVTTGGLRSGFDLRPSALTSMTRDPVDSPSNPRARLHPVQCPLPSDGRNAP